MWIFDQSDGGIRLLHLKDGHKAPPTRLRFHDLLGEWVLSAGLDSSMRSFSTVADILHRNLGTAHKNQKKAKRLGSQKAGNKLRPIVDFSSGSIYLYIPQIYIWSHYFLTANLFLFSFRAHS